TLFPYTTLFRSPVPKTPLLNADVILEKIHFASERNLVRVHFVQRDAEQFTQAQENVFRRFGVFVNQRGSRLKRVEQEVRMKLGPQVLDLSLNKSCFELGGAKLAFLGLIMNAVEVHHADNEPVRHKANLRVVSEVVPKHRFNRSWITDVNHLNGRLKQKWSGGH